MEADNLIGSEQLEHAARAEGVGTPDHTIGYELEVFEAAAARIIQTKKLSRYMHRIPGECAREIGKYAYRASSDGVYEIISPAAQHPESLIVGTQGLIATRWLPQQAAGIVTAHISIGTTESVPGHSDTHNRLISMLRAIDLTGGSSPERLTAKETSFGWYYCGHLGVVASEGIASRTTRLRNKTAWQGSNNRVELRSLEYRNSRQLASTITAAYYLSRGLLAEPGSIAAEIYMDFESWFDNYCADNKLVNTARMDNDETYLIGGKAFESYIESYADHFSVVPFTNLEDKVRTTVTRLKNHFEGGISTPTTLTTSNAPSA